MGRQGPRYVSLLGTLTLLLIIASVLVGLPSTAAAKPHFRIGTLSTRPDTVSGGNVLGRVHGPPGTGFNNERVLFQSPHGASAVRPHRRRRAPRCPSGVAVTH